MTPQQLAVAIPIAIVAIVLLLWGLEWYGRWADGWTYRREIRQRLRHHAPKEVVPSRNYQGGANPPGAP